MVSDLQVLSYSKILIETNPIYVYNLERLGGGGNSRDEDLIRNWGELSINPLTEADGRRKCYSSYHPPTSSQKPSQPTCIVSHQPRARKHRAPGISTKHQALGISTSARARRGFEHPQALAPSTRQYHQAKHQASAPAPSVSK